MMDLRSAEGKDVILTKLKCRTVKVWASLTQFWPYFLHDRLEEKWSNSQ
jgi:hypothetical protein